MKDKELENLIEFYTQTLNDEEIDPKKIVENIKEHPFFIRYINTLFNIKDRVDEKGKILSKFFDICNYYLSNKEFQYNKLTYEWKFIIHTKDMKELGLESLSSGEQQLISIFQKLYLRDEYIQERQVFIMIDEPEISLSLQWQKTFLKHLIFDSNIMGGFAVTHAPMIIDEIDQKYVSSMKEIIPQLNKRIEENEQ